MTTTKLSNLTFTFQQRKIAFLETMLYKDENNNIQTLYRKPADL